jgi:hypothetical protein
MNLQRPLPKSWRIVAERFLIVAIEAPLAFTAMLTFSQLSKSTGYLKQF